MFERVYGDAEVMRHVAGGAHTSIANTASAIADYQEHEARNGFTFWGVEEASSGELLGDCGLYLLEGRGPEIEFGVTLSRTSWGKGIATECGRACIEHAFTNLRHEQLVAVAQPGNAATISMLRKLGFHHDGSTYVYGGQHERFSLRAGP